MGRAGTVYRSHERPLVAAVLPAQPPSWPHQSHVANSGYASLIADIVAQK
jgi:hypothetical protein